MKEIGISGSHGFLGSTLGRRLEQFEPLDRTGLLNTPKAWVDGYHHYDVIFDLAAYGNMAGHKGNAKEIYYANLFRVFNIIETLPDEAKYIYVSTSSVSLPVHTYYSLSKKAAEEYLQLQDKPIAIVRPYSITGVGEQREHLIPTLIRSCLLNEEMPFVEEPHHDFIDVEDMVDALILISEKGKFEKEVYQVGRGKSYSNQEIREIVEDEVGSQANIRRVNRLREYDTQEWVSDNTMISKLGWTPKKSIRQSIHEMVKHARENITDL